MSMRRHGGVGIEGDDSRYLFLPCRRLEDRFVLLLEIGYGRRPKAMKCGLQKRSPASFVLP